MKKDLLSITDENSILITAEFLNNFEVNKVGEQKIDCYEIDLIVKNTITCSQLLTAIRVGLKNKLMDLGADVNENETASGFRDQLHPDAEFGPDPAQAIQSKARKGFRFASLNGLSPRKLRRFQAANDALEEKEAELQRLYGKKKKIKVEEIDRRTERERLRDNYQACWNVFSHCYESYLNGYPTLRNAHPNESNDKVVRHPVIARGSANYNKLSLGNKLSESSTPQLCLLLDQDNNKTLDELGFVTSTRLVFDPINSHHSCALFEVADSYDSKIGPQKSSVNLAFSDQLPNYNISERPLRQLDDTPVHIIAPTDPPQKGKQNMLSMILTPLLTTGTMVIVRMFTTGGDNLGLLLMSGTMGVSSMVVGVVNNMFQKRDHKRSVEEWKSQYEAYMTRLINEINEKQAKDIDHLKMLYPPAQLYKGADVSTISPTDEKKLDDLVSKAVWINGDIFSRNSEHPDFLTVRLGLSVPGSHLVPSAFEIQGEKKEAIYASIIYDNLGAEQGLPFTIHLDGKLDRDSAVSDESKTSGYLIDLPANLSKKYAYLNDAPVMLRLKDCRALGVVYQNPKKKFLPFLSNLLLDLCFHHSPDDLQCVMFCEETKDRQEQHNTIHFFKHLPHFRELLGDLSPFAFNAQDADLIFNKLLEILAERKASEGNTKLPHIVVIFQNEYNFKRHRLSEFLPEYTADHDSPDYGISFVFCARYMEKLPKYCGQVIRSSENDTHYLLPHEQILSRKTETNTPIDESQYRFKPDFIPSLTPVHANQHKNSDAYYRAFKTISALHYQRIAQGAGVPTSIDLFSLLLKSRDENTSYKEVIRDFVLRKWGCHSESDKKSCAGNIRKTLSVPIGRKSNEENVELDLHEKADGPHMLVAGTTGSGKTETILTYLVSLCAYYTPEQVTLLLMDMKGAGFVNRIGELPHVVGKVTDVDGDETGTSTEYMLKRFLHSMSAEVKRRKLLLNKMGVDSINGYVEAREKIDDHINNLIKSRKLDPVADADRIASMRELEPLPHLFLVIDEFTELMQFTSENSDLDFKKQITSLARIGRSLGFHIILISQNIENAITPDIRVNSRARLCLKVATKEASREMIGSDDAASPHMPGNGRAYLLVGTGSRFDYFQSAYSGADISGNIEDPVMITLANPSGKYEVFYSEKDEADKKKDTADTAAPNSPAQDAQNTIVSSVPGQNVPIPFEIELSADDESQKTQSFDEITEDTPISNMTQLQAFVDVIRSCAKDCNFHPPHQVFQQPLPTNCYYDYNWLAPDSSTYKKLSTKNS